MSALAAAEPAVRPQPVRSETAPPMPRPAADPGLAALRLFLRNPSGLLGLAILIGLLFAALAGPHLYGVDPFEIVGAPFQPPGGDPVLGTDYLGQDILAALLQGGRATLLVGFSAALITVVIGVTFGALAGFFGGRVDAALMKVTEFFQVLPTLLFAMVLVTLFGQKIAITTIAIGIVSWPPTARLTRAEFLRLRGLDFVKAARAAGAGPLYLIGRVILPNAAPPIVVSATLAIGTWGLRFSRTTSDFFVASRTVRPALNASAIGGEYLSAASFLGVAGLVLVFGADMLWYPVGWTAGYLLLLVLVGLSQTAHRRHRPVESVPPSPAA